MLQTVTEQFEDEAIDATLIDLAEGSTAGWRPPRRYRISPLNVQVSVPVDLQKQPVCVCGPRGSNVVALLYNTEDVSIFSVISDIKIKLTFYWKQYFASEKVTVILGEGRIIALYDEGYYLFEFLSNMDVVSVEFEDRKFSVLFDNGEILEFVVAENFLSQYH